MAASSAKQRQAAPSSAKQRPSSAKQPGAHGLHRREQSASSCCTASYCEGWRAAPCTRRRPPPEPCVLRTFGSLIFSPVFFCSQSVPEVLWDRNCVQVFNSQAFPKSGAKTEAILDEQAAPSRYPPARGPKTRAGGSPAGCRVPRLSPFLEKFADRKISAYFNMDVRSEMRRM